MVWTPLFTSSLISSVWDVLIQHKDVASLHKLYHAYEGLNRARAPDLDASTNAFIYVEWNCLLSHVPDSLSICLGARQHAPTSRLEDIVSGIT